MNRIILILSQLVVFIAVSPFLSGVITKIKNNLRMRKGQSVFQPYHNLAKLFQKEEVVPEASSWIFRIAPFIVLASCMCAATFITGAGDFIALIFIFALGRFFLALAALDAGSSFGGMGSSREMFISSLVEPALCLVIFSISLKLGSTNLAVIGAEHSVPVSLGFAAAALFLIVLAETSRIPVDNQETHLELTMVHEAMVLEYSGKRLAMIEMAAYVKQMIFFCLIAEIILPIPFLYGAHGFGQVLFWAFWHIARLLIICVCVAITEVAVAKMRLFRVADFLGFAFVLGIIASICVILGV